MELRGYERQDGRKGIRNVILVAYLVECAHHVASEIAYPYKKEGVQVVGFGGCYPNDYAGNMMKQLCTHPNVGGVLLVSLGCESFNKIKLEKAIIASGRPVETLVIQNTGGTSKSIASGQKWIQSTIEKLKSTKQVKLEVKDLIVGTICGGSDATSGISANPALGYASDILAAVGGSPILSEFPELCGVEQELVNRCVNDEDAVRFMKLMKAYEASAEAAGSGFDMNPSPGNIKDGLITDAMKSAGAAKKGGTSPIEAILDYGEYVTKPGLNLLCTPGNDVESTTGMVGSGANIVVFTTGLGTPTGNPITPVLKVSSNTILAERMPDIIDIDTGAVIRGEKTIQQMGEEILEYVVKVASGEIKAKADVLGQDDFIPWKRGVSL